MQVHENEEDQAVSLSKETKYVLYLLHTRDKNNIKFQGNYKISNCRYHIKDIKYMQHKKVDMSWYYRKFPCHPIAAEKFEMRRRNEIILHNHYRVYPKLGKFVYSILRITCVCPACVAQIDKYLLPNCAL